MKDTKSPHGDMCGRSLRHGNQMAERMYIVFYVGVGLFYVMYVKKTLSQETLNLRKFTVVGVLLI